MDKKYFLMGNAHLDPVWQWRISEGLSLVKSTFKAALDRMEEFPDYIFTSACAGYYKWVKCSEPEMFEKIKDKIAEGRWQYTGAMWVQPDCNIPSGEAFARHLLYSQKFFEENFGAKAESGYNVDSFGHNGMLPQLFAKAGIKNYVYHRPGRENGEKPNFPDENLHWWESPDGSRVLAFRIYDGYGGGVDEERIERYASRPQTQIIPYGVGNHGGGPTIETLNRIEELRKIEGKDKFIYSGVDKYFDYVRENEQNIPTVSEDLQHHASGCYSANSKIKMLNRKAENELVYAEKTDVLAAALTGSKTQSKAIEGAWERVMFNQFHDILAGCSIKPAYDDAYSAFGHAREVALEVGTYAAERISWRVDTTKFLEAKPSEMRDRLWIREGEGCPMVVFNPHSFPVNGYAYFGTQWVSGVVDSNDNDVEFQLVRAPYTDGGHTHMCMFNVDIPAYGYATYFIYKDEQNYQAKKCNNQFVVTDNSLENSVVKVIFDNNGAVKSYFNKVINQEYCASPMKAIISEDINSDTWGHLVFDYNNDMGEFAASKFEILDKGTLRATVKITTTYNDSILEQYYTLYKDSPKLEVKCRVNFREKYKILKLTFPIKTENPTAVYSMPYGFIKKEADGLEEPAQKWISVDGEQGGVSLINDGRYSFCVKDNEMRMVAARTCAYLDHYGQGHRDGENSFLDMDELEFTYALLPHDSDDYVATVKEAELLNLPLQLYMETHHKGELPAVYGGADVDCDNVIIGAIKRAEDDMGYVVRAFECGGKSVKAELDFKLFGCKYSCEFKPQEIKTIYVSDNGVVNERLITED